MNPQHTKAAGVWEDKAANVQSPAQQTQRSEFGPQHPQKKQNVVIHTCSPSSGEVEAEAGGSVEPVTSQSGKISEFQIQ